MAPHDVALRQYIKPWQYIHFHFCFLLFYKNAMFINCFCLLKYMRYARLKCNDMYAIKYPLCYFLVIVHHLSIFDFKQFQFFFQLFEFNISSIENQKGAIAVQSLFDRALLVLSRRYILKDSHDQNLQRLFPFSSAGYFVEKWKYVVGENIQIILDPKFWKISFIQRYKLIPLYFF